jgi:hypothetical protein
MVMILLVDVVFGYCAAAAILLASMGIYTLLVSRFLPKRLLSPVVGCNIHDRGIRKCVFPAGRGIVYEPRLTARRYINQYVIYSENGAKYIKCKINKKVKSVKYELVIYDRKNNPIEILQINQTADESGYTSAVMLPNETSYVDLRLCAANNVAFKEEDVDVYDGKNALLFLLTVFVLTLIMGLLANYVIVGFSDMLLGYLKAVPTVDPVFPLLILLAISAVTSLLALFLNLSRPCKLVWGAKKDNEKARKAIQGVNKK